MKPIFSIEIQHEINNDNSGNNRINELALVPSITNKDLVEKQRILFRSGSEKINCFIEDNEMILDQERTLYFWVVCHNASFFNYTDFTLANTALSEFMYWSTTEDSLELKQEITPEKYNEKPPKNTLGLVKITLDNNVKNKKFTLNFKVKKTYWEYHIFFNVSKKDWKYTVKDSKNEWIFTETSKNEHSFVFRSKSLIPFFNKVTNRVVLEIEKTPVLQPSDTFSMVLPYANPSKSTEKVSKVYVYL